MNIKKIKEVIALAEKLGHLFVATADKKGLPHLAAAGKVTLNEEGLLAVTSWFCPGTVLNLDQNKPISLVAWDANKDSGFQILGRLKDMREIGILDGFAPEVEKGRPIPQVQRQLLVRVDKIIEFKHAAHSDIEEK